jgi:hypothetical protein
MVVWDAPNDLRISWNESGWPPRRRGGNLRPTGETRGQRRTSTGRPARDNIGLDLHQRESQLCILTAAGELIEQRIATTRERFTAVLGPRPRSRILLEASPESEWRPATQLAGGGRGPSRRLSPSARRPASVRSHGPTIR